MSCICGGGLWGKEGENTGSESQDQAKPREEDKTEHSLLFPAHHVCCERQVRSPNLRGYAQASQNVMEDSLFNQEQSRNVTTLTKWVSSSRIMEWSRDDAHFVVAVCG